MARHQQHQLIALEHDSVARNRPHLFGDPGSHGGRHDNIAYPTGPAFCEYETARRELTTAALIASGYKRNKWEMSGSGRDCGTAAHRRRSADSCPSPLVWRIANKGDFRPICKRPIAAIPNGDMSRQ